MKKIMIFFCFMISMLTVLAQDMPDQSGRKKIDNLKMLLSTTSKPLERYKLLLEIVVGHYTYGDRKSTRLNSSHVD